MRTAPPPNRAPSSLTALVVVALAVMALAVMALAAPSAARADDWLALLPDCGFGHAAPGSEALVYPRLGLPAAVPAGDDLVARLRAPTALTPPPGVQQERVLRPWEVELIGAGLEVDERATHRYRLEVVDVRPDGHSTVVYRVRVPIPRYVAPGTYALSLRSPWARGAVAVGAVRVLEPGAEVRVGELGSRSSDGQDPVLGWRRALTAALYAPVDVWVARDEPALRAALAGPVGAPRPSVLLVSDEGPPVVLRAGATALEVGRCEPRYVPFDLQRDGAIGQLPLRRLDRGGFPAAGTVRLPDGSAAPLVGGRVRVEGRADSLAVQLPSVPGGRAELTIVVPEDGRPTTFDAALGAVWAPAVDLVPHGLVPSLAARVVAPSGQPLIVRRGAPPLGSEPLALEVRASLAASRMAERVTFEASTTREASIFWVLDEGVTSAGRDAEHAFTKLGDHEVHALAIAADGVAARRGTRVRVSTFQRLGCAVSGGAISRTEPSSHGSSAAFWLLCAFAWTMAHGRRKMRPRTGPGNMPGPLSR